MSGAQLMWFQAVTEPLIGMRCEICLEPIVWEQEPCDGHLCNDEGVRHIFHRVCIARALNTQPVCPLCRRTITIYGGSSYNDVTPPQGPPSLPEQYVQEMTALAQNGNDRAVQMFIDQHPGIRDHVGEIVVHLSSCSHARRLIQMFKPDFSSTISAAQLGRAVCSAVQRTTVEGVDRYQDLFHLLFQFARSCSSEDASPIWGETLVQVIQLGKGDTFRVVDELLSFNPLEIRISSAHLSDALCAALTRSPHDKERILKRLLANGAADRLSIQDADRVVTSALGQPLGILTVLLKSVQISTACCDNALAMLGALPKQYDTERKKSLFQQAQAIESH